MDDEGSSMGKKNSILQALVVGGGVGSNGGRICGGGGRGLDGRDGGDVGGSWFLKVIIMVVSTNAYYQNMIEAKPGNELLLGNYAKFLQEVIKKKSFFASFFIYRIWVLDFFVGCYKNLGMIK